MTRLTRTDRVGWRSILAAPLFLALTPDAGMATGMVMRTPICDGISRIVILGAEPVQINPGSRCDMVTQAFGHSKIGCIFVRRAGHPSEKIGPLCNKAEEMVRLPSGIEYMWSAGAPVRAYILLTPPQRR